MKRVLTIQDISCFGKCSITVALPIISAMGVEVAILPTSVLSTHTMFPGYRIKDLTEQLLATIAHWKEHDIRFDAIYTGYLGTKEQVDIALRIFDYCGKNATIFVDPVMGDMGKLYPAFGPEYVNDNKRLCARADVITPNITEGALLTGMEYKEEYGRSYVEEMLKKLSVMCKGRIMLTGVSLSGNKTGILGLDVEKNRFFEYQNDLVSGRYHGTGDIFSSVTVGGLVNGMELGRAAQLAADYTAKTIKYTFDNPGSEWYGVDFEATIPLLIDELKAWRAHE